MTKRVALSPNDSLWLNMDTAENLMIIESVMWFDEPLELDAVLDTLRERLIGRYPVFTWRPERPESGVGQDHWVADPAFRLEDHVHVHDVGAAAGYEAIQAFMGDRMSEPLPMGKPLWQAHILNGEDVSAIVMRFHHAIADGTALVRVLLDMTTDTPYGDSSDAAPAEFDEQLGAAAEAAESAESPTRTDLSYAPENPPVDNVPVPSDRQQVGTLDRTVGVLSNLVTWPLHLGAKATSSATPCTMSAVVPDWRTSPLTSQIRCDAAGSTSFVAIHGPSGQKVSKPLARAHWPSETCRSRALTSLATV